LENPRVTAENAGRAGDAGAPEGALLGVDVGGTFTDAVLLSDGRLVTGKVATTPGDQSRGVMAAVEQALARAAVEPGAVERFAHGMTVGTNALLEERGARTAIVATEGFTDVIEIARQTRPELYRPCRARPSPLVPAGLRFGVHERMGPEGMIEPLDRASLERVVDELAAAGVDSVAVSLLHSYADARHEQAVTAAIADRLPGVHVSASHEVLRVFREYERTSTTVIDAYLSPLLRSYLERLARAAAEAGLPEPQIMQSSGGLMSADAAARHAAWTVLSGPAGGAVAAAYLAAGSGVDDVLSFDMGGTSCDVGVIDRGRIRQTGERAIGGRALALPMVDVHTVGAGGGSIGWIDPGGALRVGPTSAGAQPGPACYGRGGADATVTDANLLLGYLNADAALAGGVALDLGAAERAVAELARRARLEAVETAAGIVRVADHEMLRALRVVTVERGIDPRSYAIVAFGGAGPMHAARLAEELEIDRVLCPRAAGVLSALGLVSSDRRRDVTRSVMLRGSELTEEAIQSVVGELAHSAKAELPDGRIEVTFDLRYRGQAFELGIEDSERTTPAELRRRFDLAHAERYGYADGDAELELVNVRVAAIVAGGRPVFAAPASGAPARSSRRAHFEGAWTETAVLTGELEAGAELEGPAVCELPEATVVVPPRWRGEVRADGTLILERAR
jgi:N-methylhydantoinase A